MNRSLPSMMADSVIVTVRPGVMSMFCLRAEWPQFAIANPARTPPKNIPAQRKPRFSNCFFVRIVVVAKLIGFDGTPNRRMLAVLCGVGSNLTVPADGRLREA